MFDSRLMVNSSPRSSGVERLLGKEEVMSSNLIAGSTSLEPLAVAASKERAGIPANRRQDVGAPRLWYADKKENAGSQRDYSVPGNV